MHLKLQQRCTNTMTLSLYWLEGKLKGSSTSTMSDHNLEVAATEALMGPDPWCSVQLQITEMYIIHSPVVFSKDVQLLFAEVWLGDVNNSVTYLLTLKTTEWVWTAWGLFIKHLHAGTLGFFLHKVYLFRLNYYQLLLSCLSLKWNLQFSYF